MSRGRPAPRHGPRRVGLAILLMGWLLMTSGRVRLLVAFTLFAGWLGWLGFAAATKSRAPVVSRAQAAAATYVVVADLHGQPGGQPPARATVRQVLAGSGPPADADIDVASLTETRGFEGDGEYLLLLHPEPGSGRFSVVGQQRSPGYELAGVGKPFIYRWSDDVRGQVKKLFP